MSRTECSRATGQRGEALAAGTAAPLSTPASKERNNARDTSHSLPSARPPGREPSKQLASNPAPPGRRGGLTEAKGGVLNGSSPHNGWLSHSSASGEVQRPELTLARAEKGPVEPTGAENQARSREQRTGKNSLVLVIALGTTFHGGRIQERKPSTVACFKQELLCLKCNEPLSPSNGSLGCS